MSKATITTIGQRVRLAREAAGMSQAELAKKIGIAQPSLHLIETRNAGTTYVFELSQALGVNVAWLATGKGPIKPKVDAQLAKLAPMLLATLKSALDDLVLIDGESAAFIRGYVREAIIKAES